MPNKYPDKKAFKQVCTELDAGGSLTLEHIGTVFGNPFWIALVYTMMDSSDAARAIQGAINRLREDATNGRDA